MIAQLPLRRAANPSLLLAKEMLIVCFAEDRVRHRLRRKEERNGSDCQQGAENMIEAHSE
jgi:hypothetical protein